MPAVYAMSGCPCPCSAVDCSPAAQHHYLDDTEGLVDALVVQRRTAISLRHALQHTHKLRGREPFSDAQTTQQRCEGRELQWNHVQPRVQAERAPACSSKLHWLCMLRSTLQLKKGQTAVSKAALLHTAFDQGASFAPEGHTVNGSEACARPNDWSVRKQSHIALQLRC